MILPADRQRLLARARQQPVDGLSRRQPARRRAGDLRVDRLADRVVDLRGIEVGVTSPASRRFLVVPSVSRRNVTLTRCASTRLWLASTLV
jgi:hypothetical protein